MAKTIDTSGTLATNPTYGMLKESDPTKITQAVAPLQTPPPLASIKDRPVGQVSDVYNTGGAVMIDDKVYQDKTKAPPVVVDSSKAKDLYTDVQDFADTKMDELKTQKDLNQQKLSAGEKAVGETQTGISQELNDAYATYKKAMADLDTSTFQITPEEQAQIDAVKKKYEDLANQQAQFNQNYTGGVTTLGVRSGLNRYGGAVQMQNIAKSISDGVKKVADIEASAVSVISQLKQEYENKWTDDQEGKYKRINDLYTTAQDFLKQKSQTIKDINDQTKADYDAMLKQQEMQKGAVAGLVDYATSSMTGDATKDLKTLKSIVDANPNVGSVQQLYSAILAKQQTLTKENKPMEIGEMTDVNGNKIKQYGVYNPVTNKIDNVTVNGTVIPDAGNQRTDSSGAHLAAGTTGNAVIDTALPGYTTDPIMTAGGLTQASIDKAAIQFAMTGQMPSIGLGSTGAAGKKREAIQNRAAELDANGQISSNKAKLASLSKSLDQQTTYLNTMERSINTVDENLKLLETLASKVNKSNKPILNQVQNLVNSKVLGSGDLYAYLAALQTVRTEYSVILARGGQVSDAVRKEAAELIPDNISKDQLNQVLGTLRAEGNNVKTQAQKQVDDVSNSINNIIGGGSLYKQQSSTGLSQQIDKAVLAGHKSSEIVDYLQNDATYGANVKSARQQGYSDDDIIKYLKQRF